LLRRYDWTPKNIYLYKTPFTSEGMTHWMFLASSNLTSKSHSLRSDGKLGARILKFLTVLLFLLIILVPTKLERSNETSNQTKCRIQPNKLLLTILFDDNKPNVEEFIAYITWK